MNDIHLIEIRSLDGVQMDWLLQDISTIDERKELATLARVALGTDALADADEILPDLDSTDRRGWWGDWEADEIWGGWPIGTKNWLLTRAKITPAPASEGSTLERARQYTYEALQRLIDKRIATGVQVVATRTELQRIEVKAQVYRGPLLEIDLRYQLLWEEPGTLLPLQLPSDAVATGDHPVVPPAANLTLNSIVPSVIPIVVGTGNLTLTTTRPVFPLRPPQGNLTLSPTTPLLDYIFSLGASTSEPIIASPEAETPVIGPMIVTAGNLALSTTAPTLSYQFTAVVTVATPSFGSFPEAMTHGVGDRILFVPTSDIALTLVAPAAPVVVPTYPSGNLTLTTTAPARQVTTPRNVPSSNLALSPTAPTRTP